MNENTLVIGFTCIIGIIVYYYVLKKALNLKLNSNVYLLFLAYFMAPISVIITIIILLYTLYKAYHIKSKLNKFIFWWILIATVYTSINYLIDMFSRSSQYYGSDPAGNAMNSGMDFLIQIIFQSIILVITIIIFFLHKNYVQKRNSIINEN